MISPIIFLQVVLQMITAFQEFTKPKLLTDGGPRDSTRLLMYKIYGDGFGSPRPQSRSGGGLSPKCGCFFALILVVTVFTFRFSNMWVYNDNTVE